MKFQLRLCALLTLATCTVLALGSSLGSARPAISASVRVPNVTGIRLGTADVRLLAKGLRPVEKGGGFFGIVVKHNWQVCVQLPAAGRSVARGAKVTLYVSRPGNC